MDAQDPQPAQGYRPGDLDLQILDLLREGPRSSYRVAKTLSHAGFWVLIAVVTAVCAAYALLIATGVS